MQLPWKGPFRAESFRVLESESGKIVCQALYGDIPGFECAKFLADILNEVAAREASEAKPSEKPAVAPVIADVLSRFTGEKPKAEKPAEAAEKESDEGFCETCRFFVKDSTKIDSGTCHRNAPVSTRNNANTDDDFEFWPSWPIVVESEWCGEWKGRT